MRLHQKVAALRLSRAALYLILLLTACKRLEKDTPREVREAIAAVQQKYCPDRRLCVFDINVQMRGANLKVVGEVSDARVRQDVVQAVKAAVANFKVEEEIRLLPDEALGHRRFGIVRVAVANLRAKPAHAAELVHQQLLGSILRLEKHEEGWYYVQTGDGYLAWVPAGSLQLVDSAGVTNWQNSERVALRANEGVLRSEPRDDALPVSTMVLGGVARRLNEADDGRLGAKKKWLALELPDGRKGFIEREHMAEAAEILPSSPRSASQALAQAKKFLGIPYLWGGTSIAGFDCSGFTQTVFRLEGIQLLRDASQQARQGESVDPGSDFSALAPGDLLFFGSKPGKITHVAISLGGAHFIHCSDYVQINSLNPDDPDYSDYRRQTFQLAKRFFPPLASNGKN